jgi:hypothetical protein
MTITLDIVDIRDRVMELCELIELPSPYGTGKAYRDEKECSWKASDLPAYVVEESGRGADYDYDLNAIPCSYRARETIRIILYLSHISDESYSKDLDSIDLANRCKAAVIHFFATKQSLQMNSVALVDRARIVRATSPHTGATKGSTTKNRIIVFNLAVEYTNYAR